MLNWLARYSAVCAELELEPSGALSESVLDVGCGPHGLSVIAPDAVFAGVDLSFPDRVAPGMVAFRNRPGPLPFEDASFDTVVCLDVLEHVPPRDRAGFVAELARVSARRVIVACPSDSGAWVETLLRDGFAAADRALPDWLGEHDEHGLPTRDEIGSWTSGLDGFATRELALTNGLMSGLTVLADMLPGLAERAAAEWERNRGQWLELLRHAGFGETYRVGCVIERSAPRTAVVSSAALADDAHLAVRCPGCDRPALRRAGDALTCTGCGHSAARESSGAWDLVRGPRPRATAARSIAGHGDGVRLVMGPASWADPLQWLPTLSRYISAVAPDRDVVLHLDGRGADVEPATLRAMVTGACTELAGDRPFAAVALLEGTVEDPVGARPITCVDELAEHLDLGRPDLPDDPAAIVGDARWAKALLDALRAEADRASFAAAHVDLAGEPLVTVRIPTWGATDALIDRAIASTLAGDWRNVEVLVCSDGPQPHARAAVAAVADRRVRYLELSDRPVYPRRRESFWQTAGTFAVNRLLDEARGVVIAPLDHDDAFTYTHVSRLVRELRDGADFAYGQAMTEYPDGDWRLLGMAPLTYGEIAHATVAYSARLAHMRYDPHAWLLGEPGDWNMWRRMRDTGAEIRHVPEPVAVHFKERSSIDGQQRTVEEDVAELAADVLATPARDLLTVCRPSDARDVAPDLAISAVVA